MVIKNDNLVSLPVFSAQTIALAHNAESTDIMTVTVPKISDGYLSFSLKNARSQAQFVSKCDGFRNGTIETKKVDTALSITSTNATACLTLYTPHMFHHNGYALFVKTQNSIGRGLHLWVENIDQRYVPVDTFLDPNPHMDTQPFIIAPQDPFGNYYAFHLENVSVGTDSTTNSIESINLYPLPYTFVTNMVFAKENPSFQTHLMNNSLQVTHPNESLYTVTTDNLWPDTLVLSQAYNAGWQAYVVEKTDNPIVSVLQQALPFIFSKHLTTHVRVNNWENGWVLANNQLAINNQIILIYLPQYLEYVGFFILAISLFIVVKFLRK